MSLLYCVIAANGDCRGRAKGDPLVAAEKALAQEIKLRQTQAVNNCWILKSVQASWLAKAAQRGLVVDRQYAYMRYLEILGGIDLQGLTWQRQQDSKGDWYLQVFLGSPKVCGYRTPNLEHRVWPEDKAARFNSADSADQHILQQLEGKEMEHKLRRAYEQRLLSFVKQRAQQELQLIGLRSNVQIVVEFRPPEPTSVPSAGLPHSQPVSLPAQR